MKAALVSWIHDPEEEQGDRGKLRELQAARLAASVALADERVPFYRDRLRAAGVRPGSVGLGGLEALPFTTKADLRATYPLGLAAVPADRLVRALASSGTTGRPTAALYTAGDLEVWAGLCARGLAAAGARAGTVVHIAYAFGLATGGPGFTAGADRLGALVVPAGTGGEERQLRLLAELGAAVLLCTPTYAITLLETAARLGVDPLALPVAAGVMGGEPAGPALRARLEAGFGLRLIEAYGLSEVIGPGVAQGCEAGSLHLNEDHFLPEIVDPATGRAVREGEPGELVLTTLTKEAMPLLRYRTGDLTALLPPGCACGRTLARLASVRGRCEDRITAGGMSFLPLDVEEIVLRHGGVAPIVQIVIDAEGPVVHVEPLAARVGVDRSLEVVLRAGLGVALRVRAVAPGSLPRSAGKAQRVVRRQGPR